MTFYVSESLKGLIEEEDLVKERPSNKHVKLSESSIVAKLNNNILDVMSIDFSNQNKKQIKLSVPDNADILKKIIKFKNNYNFSIFIDDSECCELIKYDKNKHNLRLIKLDKSFTGNNYIITIIIEKAHWSKNDKSK